MNLPTIAVATITAIASIAGAFLTAQATSSEKVNGLSTKVEVIEERENNHYLEMSNTLDRIESKLDSAIK